MTDHQTYQIPIDEKGIEKSVQHFFRRLLQTQLVDTVFLPLDRNRDESVMPALVTDPDRLDQAVPFSPAFPLNSGRIASRISFRQSGRTTAVFMRPCEHRAFIELTKLKQGTREELILVGADCCGALSWKDFKNYAADAPMGRKQFIRHAFDSKNKNFDSPVNGLDFSPACRTCENRIPVNTDINLLLYGVDLSKQILVEACSDKGAQILDAMELEPAEWPGKRDAVVQSIQEAGAQASREMIEDIESRTSTIQELKTFFNRCINCYNCRNMCPVCYCRECVFNTDVFSHQPVQYHQWAEKKGAVKLPTDTLFYHLTRMAHMSHACVGCGQCSNACPSDIPVFELFKSVGRLTQEAFDYQPGMDEFQDPPLSVFKEDELDTVVGLAK